MDRLRRNGALVFAVLFFMLCSTSMLLANKAVLKVWDLPITVAILQMAFAAAAIGAADPFLHLLRVGSWRDARKWALYVPGLFALMLASSMLALTYSSAGAVVVMRNVAPGFTLTAETLCGERLPIDTWTVLSLLFTIVGVVLYMASDLQFTPLGFACILANLAAAVLNTMVARRLLAVERVDLSKMVCVLINNVVAIPYVALLLWPTQEPAGWDKFGSQGHGVDWFLLAVSCLVGVGIGWAGVNLQSQVSATSYLVVGNLNKFLVIGLGMVFMGESHSWQSIAGCIVAISGGLLYGLARQRLAGRLQAEQAAAAAKPADPSAKF